MDFKIRFPESALADLVEIVPIRHGIILAIQNRDPKGAAVLNLCDRQRTDLIEIVPVWHGSRRKPKLGN